LQEYFKEGLARFLPESWKILQEYVKVFTNILQEYYQDSYQNHRRSYKNTTIFLPES